MDRRNIGDTRYSNIRKNAVKSYCDFTLGIVSRTSLLTSVSPFSSASSPGSSSTCSADLKLDPFVPMLWWLTE